MKFENEETNEVEIKSQVRQNCVLFPLLLNLYSKAVFEETILREETGITINSKILT